MLRKSHGGNIENSLKSASSRPADNELIWLQKLHREEYEMIMGTFIH